MTKTCVFCSKCKANCLMEVARNYLVDTSEGSETIFFHTQPNGKHVIARMTGNQTRYVIMHTKCFRTDRWTFNAHSIKTDKDKSIIEYMDMYFFRFRTNLCVFRLFTMSKCSEVAKANQPVNISCNFHPKLEETAIRMPLRFTPTFDSGQMEFQLAPCSIPYPLPAQL